MTAKDNFMIDPTPADGEGGQQNPHVIGVARKEDDPDQPVIPETLPILAIRGLVVFPGTVVPLTVRRPTSLKLLEESLPQSKVIGLVTQQTNEESPGPDDLYKIGVAANVLKLIRQPDGSAVIAVQAMRRFAIRKVVLTHPFIKAEVEVLWPIMPPKEDKEFEAAVRNLRETALRLIKVTPDVPEQARAIIEGMQDPGQMADFLASNLNMEVPDKQQLLEELDVAKRVRAVQLRVSSQYEIAQLQQKLQQDVASQFTDAQRRAYLREQIKAIQRELGEEPEGADEQIEELRKELEEAQLPPEVMEQAEKELKRLRALPQASPEVSVIVGYLESLADLPWNKRSEDNLDLNQAQKILDRDHYDLEKVKRRLIEFLAVRKLNPRGRGPILCFLGPPGVGKTSLGQSIADALGRKFARMSLGGIRDEAEIRGHRRTYIGSMPGRIIQEMRRVGTKNPVIMLDEIDKLGADFRGDPASALLEVLDPRQNNAFVDRYIDVPFDLSEVIFIATANYMDAVPAPLRDRMEVIELPGYTEREKLEIAKNYLVVRQLEENGLKPEQCQWEKSALSRVIEDYTREAGVRELERQIGAVCRGIAARVARGEIQAMTVTPQIVQEMLGPPRYIRETRLKTSKPGVVTGLAYTPIGGEVLFIEATRYPGKGNITLTGQIGNVMRESVQAALSLVRSRVKELGISADAFRDMDIHVHVPSGAVPKDGPSAGVAMFTAIASLFSDTPVRSEVAMTGEVTLRGLVLPIGGLKEKTLAALRAGIEEVIIPKLNEKDLFDLPEEVKNKLKFTLAENVDDVLRAALEREEEEKIHNRLKGSGGDGTKPRPRSQ
ncbi:endopeptidase La [Pedosphaera parvula]|uniref:Lon protease n=1 Tax=Pedosphaera parvula (strain Ellin514) TaxID=320771 RepID=B9XB79_PEDPL|nr:endopeptidase La [Pedosphaera parvula]EEF62764.1 ATP-dependent protease La [Pedosphaera parvula Ellin514]